MQTTIRLLIGVILAAVATCGFGETSASDSDQAKLQGRWELIATEKAGVKSEGLSGYVYEFSDGKVRMFADSKPRGSTTYRLNATTSPKQIDLLVTGVLADKTVKTAVSKGIYVLDRDRLTICRPLNPEGRRPTAFRTEGGSDEKENIIMETFRRISLADAAEERKRNGIAAARVQTEALLQLQSVLLRTSHGTFDIDFYQQRQPRNVFPGDWQHLVALREVKRLGFRACSGVGDGEMRYVSKLISLESLNLNSTEVGDAGVAQLRGLSNLRDIDLSFTSVSDACLAAIAGMRGLESVVLKGTSVTEKGIDNLRLARKNLVIDRPRAYTQSQQKAAAALAQLGMVVDDAIDQHLRPPTLACQIIVPPTKIADSTIAHKEDQRGNAKLYGKRVKASAVASLLSILPAPISVTIAGENSDDSVLKCIHGVEGVVRLSLQMSQVTDAGLAELNEHQCLQVLDLSRAKKITDAGVAGLSSLVNLEVVKLDGIKLTPNGVRPLLKLAQLRMLALDRNSLDNELEQNFRVKGVELKIK
jgi:uncharacterized protein (TIGR03067 family)